MWTLAQPFGTCATAFGAREECFFFGHAPILTSSDPRKSSKHASLIKKFKAWHPIKIAIHRRLLPTKDKMVDQASKSKSFFHSNRLA
jgi:hypothetical protein